MPGNNSRYGLGFSPAAVCASTSDRSRPSLRPVASIYSLFSPPWIARRADGDGHGSRLVIAGAIARHTGILTAGIYPRSSRTNGSSRRTIVAARPSRHKARDRKSVLIFRETELPLPVSHRLSRCGETFVRPCRESASQHAVWSTRSYRRDVTSWAQRDENCERNDRCDSRRKTDTLIRLSCSI